MAWSGVNQVIREAIEDRATPGACFAIGSPRGIHLESLGRLTYSAESPATDTSTIWDLASLTKVVGTTTAAMILWESGVLSLEQPVVDILPSFPFPQVTVRNLLLHDSGLPASHPDPTSFVDADELLTSILTQDLVYGTGSGTIYSDLGFIILGSVIEILAGQPLERFLRTEVWDNFGMPETGFNPSSEARFRCAPTELVEPWRKALRVARGQEDSGPWIVGEVHDPTAAVLGGIAGHAGLFSSIADLAKFMGALRGTIVKESTLKLFTSPPNPRSSRALGWDTPSDGSSAGNLFGPKSFGHTGFTGTSIWADPDRDLFAVLLTNRVHPTAENQKIRKLRVAFHDAIVDEIAPVPE